ncbi:hypothetical protein [Stygiolobus caldivivus]|uniref:YhfC family intramembrane metalloprotease n=1 Tax=Stygiolobus caldivivus TaxID=2824673 RepID=A0A8D5ZJL0_9CREN|nr:hypothetical protein [Stygiolobus caldivivus]BCU70726.1 hypothetical protein KN1_20230 [Stygiolobus caldivivus]
MNSLILVLGLISLIIGVVPLFLVKRSLLVLGIAAAAYFSAIITKLVIQTSFLQFFQTPQIPTYLAYGALTAITEPGFAYLFARFVKRYPQTYGVSLAFWENGFLVGFLTVLNGILLPPDFSISSPLLAEPLAVIILGKTMDRLSSLFLHYSWGVCAYLSFWKKDVKYILSVAPLGLLDSLTAYMSLAHVSNYLEISFPAFIVGVVGLLVTSYYMKRMTPMHPGEL